MKIPIKPYFGMSRTMYLQTLANRFGDFGVSWNFVQEDGEIGFTKKRSVLDLWQGEMLPLTEKRCSPSLLGFEKVQHREAMPIEHFIEIDDVGFKAHRKYKRALRICNAFKLQYAAYKSRQGYHISVLDPQHLFQKRHLIELIGADKGMSSNKATWSMEWTNHWKQKEFVILPIEVTPLYRFQLLGSE